MIFLGGSRKEDLYESAGVVRDTCLSVGQFQIDKQYWAHAGGERRGKRWQVGGSERAFSEQGSIQSAAMSSLLCPFMAHGKYYT